MELRKHPVAYLAVLAEFQVPQTFKDHHWGAFKSLLTLRVNNAVLWGERQVHEPSCLGCLT